MGTGFEDVGPDEVEKVDEGVLTTETLDTEGEMLDGCGSCLPVDQISVSECVFEQGSHSVNVVLSHLSDVLEHECQTFQDSVLHVQFLHSIFIHQGGENGEWSA